MMDEMRTLESLSQQLLAENEALRLHYQERSNDLGNLIKTMIINANQELSDAKHLIHFYKEHNAILAKQIQQITGKVTEHEKTINKVFI
jgi:hypothetical protein